MQVSASRTTISKPPLYSSLIAGEQSIALDPKLDTNKTLQANSLKQHTPASLQSGPQTMPVHKPWRLPLTQDPDIRKTWKVTLTNANTKVSEIWEKPSSEQNP